MPVNHIGTLLTREGFFDKAYQKGKSRAYERPTKSAPSNPDIFCTDKDGLETDRIILDLKEGTDETGDTSFEIVAGLCKLAGRRSYGAIHQEQSAN